MAEKWSIELTFYKDDEPEKVYRRSFVPFRLLKEAVKLQGLIGLANDISTLDDSAVDSIADFVVAFYGDVFTREELLNKASIGEVMTVITQIMTMIQGTGGLDPTIPGK